MEILSNVLFVVGISFLIVVWARPYYDAWKQNAWKRKVNKSRNQLMAYAGRVPNPNKEKDND